MRKIKRKEWRIHVDNKKIWWLIGVLIVGIVCVCFYFMATKEENIVNGTFVRLGGERDGYYTVYENGAKLCASKN